MPLRDTGKTVDPDRLRSLAKRASDLHLGGGIPLTEAVVQSVKDEQDLGTEHVRRIVENANNETFQRMWKQGSGDHRVINFDGGPADPGDVLKELNMGAISSPLAVSEKTASFDPWVPGEDSAEGVFDEAKTASEYPQSNPLGDAWRLREQLEGMQDHFAAEHQLAEVRHDDAERVLVKEAKQVVLGGGSTADISRVVSMRAGHPDLAKLALAKIQNHFDARGIESPVGYVLSKEASEPNPNSPFVQAYDDYEAATLHRYKVAAAIEHVDARLKELNRGIAKRLR